jgi:lysozyme family protein
MTEDTYIDGVFDREGRTYAEPPQIDQPTAPGGITLPVLTAWRGRPCTKLDLRQLSINEARDIIRANLRKALAAHGFNRITFEPLRMALLDFAWNSGEERAVRWLQRTVGVTATGTVDDRTIGAVARYPGALVNNALAAERAHMVLASPRIAEHLKDGVIRRAIGFVLPLDEETASAASK